jgi:hypothetical protein
MEITWADTVYEGVVGEDNEGGWTSLDIYARSTRYASSERTLSFRIVYWDAVGSFYFEPHAKEVPVDVVAEAIRVAKQTILVR